MTRGRLVTLIFGVLGTALIAWIATHTYWAETPIPMPMRGEARTNPFYAAQRFAEALGARTSWDRVLTAPSSDAVIIVSSWQWSLSPPRRETLERWVESGGRLVVDSLLFDGQGDFERWSRITHEYPELKDDENAKSVGRGLSAPAGSCRTFNEEGSESTSTSASARGRYWMCHLESNSWLMSTRATQWALRDATGIQALRVASGRGSVTVINAAPFRDRSLFDGDHGWLFVAATQLRRGDDVHFLSEDDHPSLTALVWQYGAPVVILVLAAIGLALWRGGVRFGPLAAAPDPARRSLAEQIRGTGQFALRHGGGESLHAAAVRALDEAAARRIPDYAHLPPDARLTALARVTQFDRHALASAIHHAGSRRASELRQTITLLETARRRALIEPAKGSTLDIPSSEPSAG